MINRGKAPRGIAARLVAGILAAAAVAAPSAPMAAPDKMPSAVVLMYHRFGEDAHPSTNIRLDQFEAHLAELKSKKYNVVPLATVVAAMTDGNALPDRTIAITIDDAYRSVFTQGWPRLKAAGFPFTVFVATAPVEKRNRGFMTWDQIRTLRDAGVTIAAHSHTHAHLAAKSDADARAEIVESNKVLEREIGRKPDIFAYPYGEASAATIAIAKENGYVAAFGQHSGVAFRGLDRHYLPRFALNETYGEIDRFRLVANALPLLAHGITPADPMVRPNANPPALGFTPSQSVGNLKGLTCFNSVRGDARIERLGKRRVEVRFDKPFPLGRARVNCTMGGPHGRWRWLGMLFYVKP